MIDHIYQYDTLSQATSGLQERGYTHDFSVGDDICLRATDLDGQAYAISALSEYLLPCPEGGHQTVRIDRVDVTDLARGDGTERTSFLTRISRLSVFGPL